MENYKLTLHDSIIRLSDDLCIPIDPTNVDYQAYLIWLGLGNTPEEADPEYEQTYQELRQQAYERETDTLFFQEQREEVPPGTWLAAINAIKDRYPKPVIVPDE